MATTIKIKRGLKDDLPLLEIGELAYCTDTNELFIGKFVSEGVTENILINEDLDEYITNASFNTTNGELTLTKSDNSTVIVDLDGRYLTSYVDTNDYVDQASFSNGTLTLTRTDDGEVAISLDGRYLQVDENGLVPADKLPSYVDDVLEGYYNAAGDSLFYEDAGFTTPLYEAPNEGEQGKIYVDLASNASYRWTGSTYVEISSPLDFATEAEAIAGTNDTKAMSPLRTKQAITDFHPDQNQVSDADNSANDNYIKSLTFDDYGHVTGVTSAEVSGGAVAVQETAPTDAETYLWYQPSNLDLYNKNTFFDVLFSTTINQPDTTNGSFFGREIFANDDYVALVSRGDNNFAGRVYVYDANTLNLVNSFVSPNNSSSNTNFADANGSVSMFGNKIIIGAYEDDTNGTNSGAAFLFDITTGNLIHTFYSPSPFSYGNFADSVAIDSNYIYISEANATVNGSTYAGKIYVYDVNTQNLTSTIENPNAHGASSGDQFGHLMIVGSDKIVASAVGEDPPGSYMTVYVFDKSTRNLLYTFDNPNIPDSGGTDNFGENMDIDEDYLVITAKDEDANSQTNSGVIYVYDLSNGSLIRTIYNPNYLSDNRFGDEIALKNKKIYASDRKANSVYVFDLDSGQLLKTIDNVDSNGVEFGQGLEVNDKNLFIGKTSFDDNEGIVYVYNAGEQVEWQNISHVTSTPSVSVTPTTNSADITVTNTDAYPAKLRWSQTSPPLENETSFLNNSQSTSGSLTNLDPDTSYTIYAQALAEGKLLSSIVASQFTTEALNLGPGPQTPIAGNLTTGFFGETTVAEFGANMDTVQNLLGISDNDSTTHNANENLLKFIHQGTVKFINKKSIRYNISHDSIASQFNIYAGKEITVNGQTYKVRLMKGMARVTGDLQNGDVFTTSWSNTDRGVIYAGPGGDWQENDPGEFGTLLAPIISDYSGSSSTPDTLPNNLPDWANYSASSLNLTNGSGNGYVTVLRETVNTNTNDIVTTGTSNWWDLSGTSRTFRDPLYRGLRLVFELVN